MIRIARPHENIPIHVQIEITWKCNWRCVHCYQDDHTIQMLNLDQLTGLFQELADCGTMHTIVTGGEPLVRKDIFEILKAIRRQGMAITLYTNGHLIDEEVAERLGSLIASAEISILAGDEIIHDQLTKVRGSFQRAWKAINALKQRNVEVVVKTPILKPALHTLRKIEALTDYLGLEWHTDVEISRSYAGEMYPLQYKLSFQELQQFYTRFPQFNPHSGYNTDPGVSKGICQAARQFCFIDALGNVYPCLNFKSACDVQEAQGDKASAKLGNILKDSFKHIWESNPFAESIRQASSKNFSTCNNCEANHSCKPCMALNYEESGMLFQPSSIVCNLTKAATSLSHPNFIPASELQIL